ncbi:MAG: MOSC domain-containing protein [Hyphomicrobiaceae bacterium]
MAKTTGARICGLYRYPVKGLTPHAMDRVHLEVGATMPFDRAYAIENGPGRFDPEKPRHLAKINFLMLMRDERLASLRTRFDDATETLTIHRDGKQVARGMLTTPVGRQMIEQFMAAYMKGALRGAPKIVSAPGHSFSDVAAKCLHIVNLASVRDLERVAGRALDPLRFRANVHIDGVPAWEEFRWLNKELQLGSVKLTVTNRTQRCEATNVDPGMAVRDTAIPQLLLRAFGHSDFGIYAKVTAAGDMAVGDAVHGPV